jgi:hypothetical protein
MKAMEMENRMLTRASRIMLPEPTKLFSTPLAFSTAAMLFRLIADIST